MRPAPSTTPSDSNRLGQGSTTSLSTAIQKLALKASKEKIPEIKLPFFTSPEFVQNVLWWSSLEYPPPEQTSLPTSTSTSTSASTSTTKLPNDWLLSRMEELCASSSQTLTPEQLNLQTLSILKQAQSFDHVPK